MGVINTILGGLAKVLALLTSGNPLQVAGQWIAMAVEAYRSPLVELLLSCLRAAYRIEAEVGDKKGEKKLTAALEEIGIDMPQIYVEFENAGKSVRDPEGFVAGCRQILDGVVKVLNSTGEQTGG